MTNPRMKRNIVPELRDVPLTFMDCENAIPKRMLLIQDWVMCKKIVGDCQWIREHEKCPRGFR